MHSCVRRHHRIEESRAVPLPRSYQQSQICSTTILLVYLIVSPFTVLSIRLHTTYMPKLLANLKHNRSHSSPRARTEPWSLSSFRSITGSRLLYFWFGGPITIVIRILQSRIGNEDPPQFRLNVGIVAYGFSAFKEGYVSIHSHAVQYHLLSKKKSACYLMPPCAK